MVGPVEGEDVPLGAALGRVTAAPVWARLSSPHYHAAAMDGAAVRAEDTEGASEATPVRLAIGVHTPRAHRMAAEAWAWIASRDTRNPFAFENLCDYLGLNAA